MYDVVYLSTCTGSVPLPLLSTCYYRDATRAAACCAARVRVSIARVAGAGHAHGAGPAASHAICHDTHDVVLAMLTPYMCSIIAARSRKGVVPAFRHGDG